MQMCINPDCETIHLSDNLIKCQVCGHPFNDYGIIDNSLSNNDPKN